jgi:MscS family membrane protein
MAADYSAGALHADANLAMHAAAATNRPSRRAEGHPSAAGPDGHPADYGNQTQAYFQSLWPATWGDWMYQGISLAQLSQALALLLVGLLLRWLIIRGLRGLGRGLRQRRILPLDRRSVDTLHHVISHGLLLATLFCSISVLDLPRKPIDWQLAAWRLWLTGFAIYAVFIFYRTVYLTARRLMRPGEAQESRNFTQGSFPLLRDLLKVAAMILAVLMVVETWGYNATALLAGVGLGGLAIAFAAQDTIANVFGSIIIYSDRPFKVGDWVKIGGVEGDVEEIGIRSTRIRKFDRTVVLVPNKRVTNEEITNYSAMTARRLTQTIFLDKSNPPAKIQLALELMRDVLRAEFRQRTSESGSLLPPRLLEHSTWFVRLTAMTQTSYELSIYAFAISTEWLPFLELQEDVLLACLRSFEENGITVAQLPAVALPAGKA